MWQNRKISGSQNESEREAEERVLKPSDRGTAVENSKRRGGRKARRSARR